MASSLSRRCAHRSKVPAVKAVDEQGKHHIKKHPHGAKKAQFKRLMRSSASNSEQYDRSSISAAIVYSVKSIATVCSVV